MSDGTCRAKEPRHGLRGGSPAALGRSDTRPAAPYGEAFAYATRMAVVLAGERPLMTECRLMPKCISSSNLTSWRPAARDRSSRSVLAIRTAVVP
jgi:uncharacterized membrane protein